MRLVGCLLIVLLVAACAGGREIEPVFSDIGQQLGSTPGSTSPPLVWEQVCPGSDRLVTYYVDGSARGVDITINNRQGNTEQATGRALPLAVGDREGLRVGCVERGFFYYISAQNTGDSGSVRCRVEVDGREVSTASSSGSYVIASCSGSTP